MASCKADIRKWSMKELQAYQAGRVNEWIASGRFPVKVNEDGSVDAPEVIAKCNEELEAYDADGACGAKCACGWVGINPYPSKATALSSLQAHYDAKAVSDG